ncbi:MAG TPA: zinc-dependent dehydrogenase [Desulfatiglandales bacterium]|nr:zinc-dependent dehydrogenase [Desulfatiglandales bacterium]
MENYNAHYMKCAMYYNNKDIRLEEIPVPKIGQGELLVQMHACGICGSDVLEWYRIKKAPIILGHEMTGRIVKKGRTVTKYNVGDRVFVSHHVPCNTCYYCLKGYYTVCDTLRKTNFDPGGFSEFIRIPEINVNFGVFLLPEEISYEEGTFIEPLACVLRGQKAARLQPGQTVLIIGGGISGLLHLKLARALGAGAVVVTDIHKKRLEYAERFGAAAAVPSNETTVVKQLKKLNYGRLADIVIVSAGAINALHMAWKTVDRGGTILLFAPPEPETDVPLPLYDIWHDGITVTTSYAGSPLDIAEAIELIKSKNIVVDDMITHRFPLARADQGFTLVEKAHDSIKVILTP